MRFLKPTAIVLAMSVLTLATAGSASAAVVKSTVKITDASGDGDGVVIKGKVTSAKNDCIKSRKVFVYHDVPPPGPSEDDFFLGAVRTNDQGKWRLVADELFPDKVYAKISRKNRSNADDCGSSRSGTKTVEFE